MNHLIKCPDCNSHKLTVSGMCYERININPLICLDCGYLFMIEEANIQESEQGNLHRILFSLTKINELKAIFLYRQITGAGKKEAKELVSSLRFEDIRTK